MSSFHLPSDSGERVLSAIGGVVLAVALFVVMALVQMIGDVKPPDHEIAETIVKFNPPEVEDLEEEEPPPPEEEEPPPDQLEPEPPQLSLDQLDIALNPGTGGSLAGDFALPTIAASARSLGTEDFVDFSELDQMPRPMGASLPFPSRLKRKPVRGRIVLLFKLSEKGEVLDVSLDSSDLPAFNDFVLGEARRWRFTPPTKQGRPVRAKALLPIPIVIK